MAIYPSAAVEGALHAAAVAQSVPLSLLRAIAFVESSFDPNATGAPTSTGRAQGLMQLMPATQQTYGVTDPFDPKQSADAAARFLVKLAKPLAWKLDAMIAAYYMGAVAYARNVAAKLPIPKPAADFVRKVLAAQRFYQQQVQPDGDTLWRQLDAAIRTLAKLNPQWAPATLALQSWRPYFADYEEHHTSPTLTNPELLKQWANYRAAYARAPITETLDGDRTIGAPLPELVQPDIWQARAARIKQSAAIPAAAVNAAKTVLESAERAAKEGVIGAIALAIAFIIGLSRRR